MCSLTRNIGAARSSMRISTRFVVEYLCLALCVTMACSSGADFSARDARLRSDTQRRSLRETDTSSGQSEEAPDDTKRPFKLATYYIFQPGDPEDVMDFVQDDLMPTVSSLLARWLRVRFPSGELDFAGELDYDDEPIPPGPDGNGAYDADLVLKVQTGVRREGRCGDAFAVARAVLFEPGIRRLFEPGAGRTIFGQMLVCSAVPATGADLSNAVQNVLHEMLHVLGFQRLLFETWAGVETLSDILEITPEADRPPPPPGVRAPVGPEVKLRTPNALREARLHIGCPTMDAVLMNDQLFGNTPPEHWSMRHYNGELMRAGFAASPVHYGREAMTDMTLGMLQDTGWYDVKYGSGGFNSYGYQAGCTFVMGTFEEALADPAAARYLCPIADNRTISCFHDFSGQGRCRAQRKFDGDTYDDLFTVDMGYDGGTFDCQDTPGSRCLNVIDDDGTQQLICSAGMSCSEAGQVTISGVPCIDLVEPELCPPDDLMCSSPGLLTCATPELNDCNGLGDCFEGRCYCHFGFGGDDCTVSACTSGCPDGSACPPSGFCGEPECGEWSVGDTGRGTPCT
eukprot:jgi/Ulvmu1/3689/UM017_0105.1